MTALSFFYDYIMPDAPSLGSLLADQIIRDTAIDFCERTNRYKYDITPINVVASTHTYTLTSSIPANTQVHHVLEAFIEDDQLFPATRKELDLLYSDWRESGGTGDPKYFFMPDTNQIRLVRTPSTSITGGLELQLSLKPTRSATTVPGLFEEHYTDAIQHGAKWKLFAMLKKPWTDPALAGYHQQQYLIRCGEASGDSFRDGTRMPLRSKAYKF